MGQWPAARKVDESPMATWFCCPQCSAVMSVADELIGKSVRCQKCGFQGTVPDKTSQPSLPKLRYPNLFRYLAILSVLATLVFACSAISAVATLIVAFTSSANPTAFSLTCGMSVTIFLAGYLQFIGLLALIEFVHVVIDIESNTRAQTE